MKRVILCHRWGGTPDSIWYPSVARALEAEGFRVSLPAMPEPDVPELGRWLPALAARVGHPDERTFLVGHSLGCATILRYLEGLDGAERVGGVVLVAGFAEDRINPEVRSFFVTPLDLARAKAKAGGFVAIHSDDDPAAAPDHLQHALRFLRELSAKLIVIPGGGHFSVGEDTRDLPEVVHAVRELAG